MPCPHEHDPCEHDDAEGHAVIDYMVRAYLVGREINPSHAVVSVHASESGDERDRLLTLHIATGPRACARLVVHHYVGDVTEYALGQQRGPWS